MTKISELKDANNIIHYSFYCPGCKNHHSITSSWTFNRDYNKPTISPSILVQSASPKGTKRICHSFVKDGMIQFLGDCTHDLKNQTVEIPDED